MRRFARYLILAPLATAVAGPSLVAPAAAQAIPPGQTCGGLLCDMGVLGRKVAPNPDGAPPTPAQVAAAEASDPHRLPCNDFLCRAFGGKPAEAAAPAAVPPPVAEVEPAAPAKKARKKKRVAKAEAPAEPKTATAPASDAR